ncbi:hypothetical protein NB311A_17099 [Nitrobacter sp. Nb-311A]|uniref:hypothetical protein n=1 Tax=Nitrobacter sp. Nb-311A TaxID=314253 RepID=UPI0000687379|nr:hypothetical protein [Nitrobacter sp. Nb-311A]EAQ35514.1 hypothetical protein NB311A_17099 [Nitrobacter sp. Nb-311A]
MAKVSWFRRFQDPITMPDGRIIRTIGEAAEYAVSLPRKVGNTEPWQLAARVLQEAAEHGGPFVFMARVCFAKAVLFGEKPRRRSPTRTAGRAKEAKAEVGEKSVKLPRKGTFKRARSGVSSVHS